MVSSHTMLTSVFLLSFIVKIFGITDLFTSGISNYSWSRGNKTCYRIPSIVKTPKGTLIAFASERISGAAGFCSDDSISNAVYRVSKDNGETWGEAQLVSPMESKKETNWGWTIVDTQSSRIFLFGNVNAADCKCDVQYTYSDDEGTSWQKPIRLAQDTGVYGSALTHGITHRKTKRLVGCMRRICRNSCPKVYNSKSFFSDDGGKSWQTSKWLAPGTTECQIAELSDGSLYLNSRPYIGWSGQKNVRLASWSHDAGTTWSEAVATELVDWAFADEGSLFSDPENDRVYFVHPDSHSRSNLTLWKSSGNASHFEIAATIYSGAAAYSDGVVLDAKDFGGEGRKVGVVFEKDGYKTLSYEVVQV
eukprot:g3829.t1